MKLRVPDYKKNNLWRVSFFIELPLTDDFVDFVDRLKARKKKGKGLAILTKEDRARIDIKLSPQYRGNLEVLEDILTSVKDHGENKVAVTSIVSFKYSANEYETDPSLPVKYPESGGKTDRVLLTGVKLNFIDPASSLEHTIIELQRCLDCGEYHTITNQILCSEEMAINGHLVINAIKIAKKYSETFIKRKKK